MKKVYTAPKVEKLDFAVTTDPVVASGGSHGDNGNGHGCKGDPISSDIYTGDPVTEGEKTRGIGKGNKKCN